MLKKIIAKLVKKVGDMEILYEDENMLALLKPAGISVHHDGKTDEAVITDWLVKKFPKIKKVGEPTVLENGTTIDRPGIVHRLDKGTSGVLLVAKTDEGYDSLKHQFKERLIKKTYHAFLYGKFKDERGIIDKPIGRATGSVRKWATGGKARGELRPAITRYKIVKNESTGSFAEVWPLTGRTHQIRVHMASLGHPVIGDLLYAPSRESLFGFGRLALHASKIVFEDLEGKKIEVTAPFPEDFKNAMNLLEIKQ